MWDKLQAKLFTLASPTDAGWQFRSESADAPLQTFLPSLLKGASITIFLSVLSMALAILLEIFITLIRLYGNAPLRAVAASYVEIYRGTPLLIQLLSSTTAAEHWYRAF